MRTVSSYATVIMTIFRLCFGGLLAVAVLLCQGGIAGAGSTRVQFPSLDDNDPGQPPTMLDGFLFLPPRDGRHPAIIFRHGCSGLGSEGSINPREMEWAAQLNGLGYAVLMVDSFAPRNLVNLCSLRASDPARWFELLKKREKDAQGALAYLRSQAYVEPDRIGVIGWSQGGGVVLMLLNGTKNHLPAVTPRAAVSFYPVLCSDKEQSAGWMSNVPLLLLQGWNDTWTPAPPCKSFVDGVVARGAKIEMQIYPGAYHGFDLPGVPLHLQRADAPEGTWPYVGTDPVARKDAFARVPAFLAKYLLQ
jgi:dienelactone hydrolase